MGITIYFLAIDSGITPSASGWGEWTPKRVPVRSLVKTPYLDLIPPVHSPGGCKYVLWQVRIYVIRPKWITMAVTKVSF